MLDDWKWKYPSDSVVGTHTAGEMKNFTNDPESSKLLASLSASGVKADGAIPAFQGSYPTGGGWASWELSFGQQRVVSFHHDGIRVWRTEGDGEITTEVTAIPRSAVEVHDPEAGASFERHLDRYFQLEISPSLKLWVHRSWLPAICAWRERELAHSAR